MKEKEVNKKIKTGLALGSGGAKGMAHLGAIKAFEEEGITFDVYAGTSIGSLVGALLAKGLTAEEIMNVTDEMRSSAAAIMLTGLSGGLVGMMRSMLKGAYFSDLIKPFNAVATEMKSGKEVVFSTGDLATAVAASCAIPPVFAPVKYGNYQLIDGAYLNYVPADRCLELGADVVVGINLGKGRTSNAEGKKTLDEMYPYNGVPLTDRSRKGYAYSSVMLEPDLSAYKSFSVARFEEMFEIGYEEGKNKTKEIKRAIAEADVRRLEESAEADVIRL